MTLKRLLSIALSAFMASTAMVSAQEPQNSVDFSSQLNRLKDSASKNRVKGSWGSLLQSWKEGDNKIADQKRQKKLDALKRKCQRFWPNPSTIKCTGKKSLGLVLTSTRTPARIIARKKCDDGVYKVRWRKCVYHETIAIERKRAADAAQSVARSRRDRENRRRECVATRSYCNTIQSDVKAGRLPQQSYPNWSPQDKLDLKEASKALDKDLQAALNEALAYKKQGDRADSEAQAKRNALIQKKARLAAKAAAREAAHEKSCLKEMSNGTYPCGCSKYFRKRVGHCNK